MSKTSFLALMFASFSLTACVGSALGPGEAGEEDVATTRQAAEQANGLAPNGITANGITANGITANGITANGITANGITANGLVMSALTSDPTTQQFFTYLVSCALAADQQLTLTLGGQDVTFYGGLGLAPAWGSDGGSCDNTCQVWVSACMLSRVNFYGQHVPLSERGSDLSLSSTSDERSLYPNREGAYWGNIFTSPQVRYACTEPGSTLISRSCGPDPSASIMTFRGDCDAVCDRPDPTDGSYSNCQDASGAAQPTVTVFRLAP